MARDAYKADPAPALPDDGPTPGLIRPAATAPVIDLSKPEDCPDLADGEWSRRHLEQFLARQPYSMVFIPAESWEPRGVPLAQTIGYMGHWFTVAKGRAVQVPVQIAAIIEQSQEEFPTMQSQARKRRLTDLSDLPPQSLGSRGQVEGVEVQV